MRNTQTLESIQMKLGKHGLQLLDTIKSELGVNLNKELDSSSLFILCNEYDTYMEASAKVKEQGIQVSIPVLNRHGEYAGEKLIANPLLKVVKDAFANYSLMAKEFGLSPKSRNNTKINIQTSNPFNEFD
jgi:P27 family predicted phage terminase small subunit